MTPVRSPSTRWPADRSGRRCWNGLRRRCSAAAASANSLSPAATVACTAWCSAAIEPRRPRLWVELKGRPERQASRACSRWGSSTLAYHKACSCSEKKVRILRHWRLSAWERRARDMFVPESRSSR